MTKFKIHRCAWCHAQRQELTMVEYNDKFYCSIICKRNKEGKENEDLRNPPGRNIVHLRPGSR